MHCASAGIGWFAQALREARTIQSLPWHSARTLGSADLYFNTPGSGLRCLRNAELKHPVVQIGVNFPGIQVAAQRKAARVQGIEHFALKQFYVAPRWGRRSTFNDQTVAFYPHDQPIP